MNRGDKLFILCVVTAIALLCFIGPRLWPEDEKSEISHRDTLFIPFPDSTWHSRLVPYPEPYLVQLPGAPGSTITIPAVIDTGAIIRDYFTKRFYRDSLKNDSIDMYVHFSVNQNKAYDLKMDYRWHLPQMIIKETEVVSSRNLYAGVDVTGSKDHFGAYASAYLDTKKGMIGYGYDPFNRYHKVGVYYKFTFKPPKRKCKK